VSLFYSVEAIGISQPCAACGGDADLLAWVDEGPSLVDAEEVGGSEQAWCNRCVHEAMARVLSGASG
jgi:hypothetical protein